MTIKTTLLTITATLALAACNTQPDPAAEADQPDEAGVDEMTPDPDAPVSILRPDVEQPEQPPVLLEPLALVIGFPKGGDDLDALAVEQLNTVLASEQLATSAKIVLRGHSDAGGNDAANERASQARAEAVRDWLIGKGVAKDRFTIITFGEQNPAQPNALPNGEPNEPGRAANRRVELQIVPPEGTIQKEGAPTTAPSPTASREAGDQR